MLKWDQTEFVIIDLCFNFLRVHGIVSLPASLRSDHACSPQFHFAPRDHPNSKCMKFKIQSQTRKSQQQAPTRAPTTDCDDERFCAKSLSAQYSLSDSERIGAVCPTHSIMFCFLGWRRRGGVT